MHKVTVISKNFGDAQKHYEFFKAIASPNILASTPEKLVLENCEIEFCIKSTSLKGKRSALVLDLTNEDWFHEEVAEPMSSTFPDVLIWE